MKRKKESKKEEEEEEKEDKEAEQNIYTFLRMIFTTSRNAKGSLGPLSTLE